MEKQKLHNCPYCGSTVYVGGCNHQFVACSKHDCQYTGPRNDSDGMKHNEMCRLVDIGKRDCEERLRIMLSLPLNIGWKNKKEAQPMNQKGSTNTVIGAIKMLESLQEAVKNAGGTPERYSVEELKNMTAMDLIAQLGCNDIRFCSGKAERV